MALYRARRGLATIAGQIKLPTRLAAALSNWRDAKTDEARAFQKSVAAHCDASKMQASLESKLTCSYALRKAVKKQNNYHIALARSCRTTTQPWRRLRSGPASA